MFIVRDLIFGIVVMTFVLLIPLTVFADTHNMEPEPIPEPVVAPVATARTMVQLM